MGGGVRMVTMVGAFGERSCVVGPFTHDGAFVTLSVTSRYKSGAGAARWPPLPLPLLWPWLRPGRAPRGAGSGRGWSVSAACTSSEYLWSKQW